MTPEIGVGLAIAGLALAWLALPRAQGTSTLPRIPAAELWLRLTAAFALAVLIVWGAQEFGPVVSGVLLSVPVTGSIMPPFTLALYGPDALARLMRGFVIGLTGFTAFFLTLSEALVPWGIGPAFFTAIALALVTVSAARHIASGR